MRVRCRGARRRSRYRYWSRFSSAVSIWSSMGNGVGSLRLKISTSVPWTSISPVLRRGFTLVPRETTLPRMPTQYSSRTFSATSCTSGRTSSSKTTWVTPTRSRRSMKTAPPWSRRLLTQPKRTTSLPMSSFVSWPQLWVRFSSEMKRATRASRRDPRGTLLGNTGRRGASRRESPRSGARRGGPEIPDAELEPAHAVPVVEAHRDRRLHRPRAEGEPVAHLEGDGIPVGEDEFEMRPAGAHLARPGGAAADAEDR